MIAITLRFNYPWGEEDENNLMETDENEVYECISELTPEELIMAANNAGEPINVDVEVY